MIKGFSAFSLVRTKSEKLLDPSPISHALRSPFDANPIGSASLRLHMSQSIDPRSWFSLSLPRVLTRQWQNGFTLLLRRWNHNSLEGAITGASPQRAMETDVRYHGLL